MAKYEDYKKKAEQEENKIDVEVEVAAVQQEERIVSTPDVDWQKRYEALEIAHSRQGNQLGDYRKLVDDFISTPADSQEDSVDVTPITPDDIYENPAEAVNRAVEAHPAIQDAKKLKEDLEQQKRDGLQEAFNAAHPDYQETANSDVVVITSGVPRKPGMTREELLQTNMNIITEVTRNVVSHSPDCILIMVTNPLDAMTYLALRTSQFPKNRVIGLSGVLDTARLRSFIAAELNVSVEDVFACILGQHGEKMVILPRLCTVCGVSITKLLPQETINRLVERTLKAGAEIVGLLKTGSAFYAPS
ncbi:hypothetical protein LCGC14_2870570, partial [marine sediment metagenome]